ncbi:MAG: hypothetical protein V4613_12890 [Bacteroidota bacterium]
MILTDTIDIVTKESEILKIVNYYNIFKHPLRAEEIYRFLPFHCTIDELNTDLQQLVDKGQLYFINEHYTLKDDAKIVATKIQGEEKASELLPKAMRVGRLLSRFPFVRFVGISGSLSKQYADDKTDFDFFIITANNRLWICRTLLHLFKKLTFLLGRQKYFCMNYFIDESSLEIEDKNIFVINEIATLVPVYNASAYHQFLQANHWALQQLPHFKVNTTDITNKQYFVKSVFEKTLGIFPLESLNQSLMNFTDRKWKRKWNKAGYPMSDYDLAFRTRINISKNHPRNHQKIILKKFSNWL